MVFDTSTLNGNLRNAHGKSSFSICHKVVFFSYFWKKCIQFPIHEHLTITKQSLLLSTLRKNPFENIVGKGENAGNQHFLLFLQCFLSFPKHILAACKCFQIGHIENCILQKRIKRLLFTMLIVKLLTYRHASLGQKHCGKIRQLTKISLLSTMFKKKKKKQLTMEKT